MESQRRKEVVKTKAAIEKLVDNGISVQISCPIMKQNLYYYREVIKWGRAHDINVNSDYVIIGQYNHSLDNLNCRLCIEEVNEVIQNDFKTDPDFENKLVKQQEKEEYTLGTIQYVVYVFHHYVLHLTGIFIHAQDGKAIDWEIFTKHHCMICERIRKDSMPERLALVGLSAMYEM